MYTRGREYLDEEEYDEAIKAFVLELQKDTTRAEVWRDLGIALYKIGDERSSTPLQKAFSIDSSDALTAFMLGTISEERSDFLEAIDYYRRYRDLSGSSEIRDEIEARLSYLTRKQLEFEAREALEAEESLDIADIPEQSIAVLNFKNLGKNRALDPLQKGLTDMVITDLSVVRALDVVERSRLAELMDEIGFGDTGLVDDATAPRVGKLLGAGTLVKGSFLDLNEESIRLDAGMTTLKEGSFQTTKGVTGDLDRFFRLEKELVFAIVDRMGITLSPEEREAILTIPTQSLSAFLAYSEGLDFEDRGQMREAKGRYQRALTIDPRFSKAQRRLEQTNRFEKGAGNKARLQRRAFQRRLVARAVRARLQRSGFRVNAGVLAGKERRKPVQERDGEIGFGSIKLRVEIPIPVR